MIINGDTNGAISGVTNGPIKGYLYADDGIATSMSAMQRQIDMLSIHTTNLANFAVPGYQKKEAVVTSFKEFLDKPNTLDTVPKVDTATNTEVGRLRLSGNPLDVSLKTKGYFQKLNSEGGIEFTRDGRFRLDKNGALRALDGKPILSSAGTPIQFSVIPPNPEKSIKFTPSGEVLVYSPLRGKTVSMGYLGVADEQGIPVKDVEVRQGFVEDSNVIMQDEFTSIMPIRRQFEANRQLYILQDSGLTHMIQELGRAQ